MVCEVIQRSTDDSRRLIQGSLDFSAPQCFSLHVSEQLTVMGKKVCVWINNHSHTLEVNITKMNAHVCIMCRML